MIESVRPLTGDTGNAAETTVTPVEDPPQPSGQLPEVPAGRYQGNSKRRRGSKLAVESLGTKDSPEPPPEVTGNAGSAPPLLPGGRPPITRNRPLERPPNMAPSREVIEPLPKPPMFDFTPEPAGFFKYWAASPEDRVVVYVWRNWPVCDPMLLLSPEELEKVRRREMKVVTNIAKLGKAFESRHWEGEMLHRFGSGDYHLKLNDVALKKPIAMVSIRGLRDFDNYPPVLDRRAVVLSDPANSSYLERMRLKGIKFPGDPGVDEEESEMANVEVVRELAGAVQNMADKLVNQANKPPVGPSLVNDPKAQGELKAVESVAEGARQGFKILGDAMAKAQEAQVKAQDPREYLRDVLEISRAMAPPAPAPAPVGDGGGGAMLQTVMGMFTQMMQMQRDSHALMVEELKSRLAFTERLATDAAQRAMQATNPQNQMQQAGPGGPMVAGAPVRPPSMLDELDRMLQIKERLDTLGGGGGDDAPGWMRYGLQAVSILATAGTNIAYNLAAAKGATGAVPPPPMPGMLPEGQEGQEGAAGAGGEAPMGPQGGSEQMNIIGFVQRLHGPLVKALNEGVSGSEFAARMILHEGAVPYDWLYGQGKDRIISLMQLYPPLWQDVIKVGARMDAFLDEFLDREEALAIAQDMTAQMAPQGPPPQMAPQGAPMTHQGPQIMPRAPQGAPSTPQGPQVAPEPPRRTVIGSQGQKVEVIPPAGPTGAGAGAGPVGADGPKVVRRGEGEKKP